MPKAKWGSALTADMVEQAKESEFAPYAGPTPPSGVYRFILKRAKQAESNNGNPKLMSILELDSIRPEHKKFKGAPVFDHMPVMDSTAFRVKAFCSALGIKPQEFFGSMVVDDEGRVQKIGKVDFTKTVYVWANVKRDPNDETRLILNGGGYMRAPEAEEDGDTDAGDEPKAEALASKPAKKVKGSKAKGGKSVEGDEPPF